MVIFPRIIVPIAVIIILIIGCEKNSDLKNQDETSSVVSITENSYISIFIKEITKNKTSKLAAKTNNFTLVLFDVFENGETKYFKLDLSFNNRVLTILTREMWSREMLEVDSIKSISIKRVSSSKLMYIVGVEEYEYDENTENFRYSGEILF